MDQNNISGKKALVAAAIVLGALYLWANPDLVKDFLSKGDKHPRSPEIRRAELQGKLKHALMQAQEERSFLSAYQRRFDCPEAANLDALFLNPEGAGSIHQKRSEWYDIRRELPEFVMKHDKYIATIKEAMSEVQDGDPATIDKWSRLPAEAEAWSAELHETITERTKRLEKFILFLRRGY